MGLFDFFKKKTTTVDSTVAQTPPQAPAPEMPATAAPTPQQAPGETTPPQQ